ncbi:MAG: sulfotransferase [Gammaproteobacteria bacterium]|nr:sulfotransferase [Gammaproteobacteria bacterium]
MNSKNYLLDQPIIFVGPGRSGSTIISEIVFAHEDLAWPSNHLEIHPQRLWLNHLRRLFDNGLWRVLGEKSQLNRTPLLNYLAPRPAEAYPFWENVTRTGIEFSRDFLLNSTASSEERRRIREAVIRIVACQKRKRFAMKITGPGRIGYLKSVFPDAIFVNVVREIDATVASLLKVPFWEDLGKHRLWWTGAYTAEELSFFETIKHDPTAVTAFQVKKVMDTMEKEAQDTGARMLTVQYEDFLEAPNSVVGTILEFCRLPHSAGIERKLADTKIRKRRPIESMCHQQRLTINSVLEWSPN